MNRRDWLAAALAGVSPAVLRGARQTPPAPPRPPAASGQAKGGAAAGDATLLSIAELDAAFTAGRLTPTDVTAAYLQRIDAMNGALGAFVTVTRDRADADTRRALMRGAAGAPDAAPRRPGPLAGVPIAHKDLFATRGIRTTGGSKLHETWIPDDDAEVVRRLAAAGTVLLGKTNTHELGGGVTTINPFFGTTHNPHDPARIAGGSSGGSAAAVAARLALVATGSDTGGSVRIPAALCGCVGVKPSFGLVPTAGLLGACPTFDHAGVLARSCDDALAVLAVMADETAVAAPLTDAYRAAQQRGLKGVRIGVPRAFFFAALDADVARAVEQALAALQAGGAVVRDVALPVTDALYDRMFAPIAVSEIRATYARDWAARPDAFSPDFAAVFAGPGPSPAEVTTAREARLAFERTVADVLAGVDVLAMPTVPLVAPRIAGPIDGMRILRHTWPFNAARVPAVSVPCGTGNDGLPVGLQLVGRMGDDARLLAIASCLHL